MNMENKNNMNKNWHRW